MFNTSELLAKLLLQASGKAAENGSGTALLEGGAKAGEAVGKAATSPEAQAFAQKLGEQMGKDQGPLGVLSQLIQQASAPMMDKQATKGDKPTPTGPIVIDPNDPKSPASKAPSVEVDPSKVSMGGQTGEKPVAPPEDTILSKAQQAPGQVGVSKAIEEYSYNKATQELQSGASGEEMEYKYGIKRSNNPLSGGSVDQDFNIQETGMLRKVLLTVTGTA